jgi:hypothetical protein
MKNQEKRPPHPKNARSDIAYKKHRCNDTRTMSMTPQKGGWLQLFQDGFEEPARPVSRLILDEGFHRLAVCFTVFPSPSNFR